MSDDEIVLACVNEAGEVRAYSRLVDATPDELAEWLSEMPKGRRVRAMPLSTVLAQHARWNLS